MLLVGLYFDIAIVDPIGQPTAIVSRPMDYKLESFRPRRPRHQATDATGHCLQLERGPGKTPRSIDAKLLNLSSAGAGFRVTVLLEVGEAITFHLRREPSQLLLTRSGTVRWASRDEQGDWTVGCLFDRRVDWETLGELFLKGILSTNRPAFPAAAPGPTEVPADPAQNPFDS